MMPPWDAEKVEAALEPHVGTLENSPIISIAISLKRIADVLEAQARGSFNYYPPHERKSA